MVKVTVGTNQLYLVKDETDEKYLKLVIQI